MPRHPRPLVTIGDEIEQVGTDHDDREGVDANDPGHWQGTILGSRPSLVIRHLAIWRSGELAN
jgi:hypothetical protein